jgi:hypothetical protein
MTPPRVPKDLRRRIAADLEPVRPLAPPWRRALVLAPVGMLLAALVLGYFGRREDLPFAAVAGGGLSKLEALAGVVFVGLALYDAIPGRIIARRALVLVFLAGCALVTGITVTTLVISPSDVPPGLAGQFAVYCLEGSTLVGLPALLVAAALAARALPVRPLLVGALYGFGSGLLSDSGWRLYCSTSALSHVLLAHGGAIVVLTIAGAVLAEAIDRTRWRRR